MFPPCWSPVAIPRRTLCKPVRRSAERQNLSDARVPLGSLQEYDPADFARLVEALVILNLREAAANLAALIMSS